MKSKLKIIGLMAVYNEADVLEGVLQHAIKQGLELVILDNGSVDGSYDVCKRHLNRGVLEIEREETKSFDLIFNLRRLEENAQKYQPDWLAIIDSDEIHEPPRNDMTLKEAIQCEWNLGFNLIQSNHFEFWPTPLDDENETNPLKRLKYYAYTDDFHFPFWRNYSGTDCWSGGSHFVFFPPEVKWKVSPNKFVIRHYKIRSLEQGRRKTLDHKIKRFKHPPLPDDWMIHYDRFLDDRSYFVKDPGSLTRYDENGKWNLECKLGEHYDWLPSARTMRKIVKSGIPVSRETRKILYEVGTRLPPNEEVIIKILSGIGGRKAKLRAMLKPRQNNMRGLMQKLVPGGSKRLHPSFRVIAPIVTLRNVYNKRIDLQITYPEVQENGDYGGLIEWAVKHGVSSDSSKDLLEPYTHWYTSYLRGLKELGPP
jgi:glycosyltransferase involved in cell wall biosynthesis